MRPRLTLLGFSAGAACLFAATSAWALDPTRIASDAKPAVVLVSLFDAGGAKAGSGSGFFASTSGKLVTNHHVIEEAARATVTLADGRELPVAGILVDDREHDIAVLQVNPTGAQFVELPLGHTASLHPGADVAVVGSPLGLSTTISTGIVSAVRGDGLAKQSGFDKDGAEKTRAWGLQITAPIAPGSSGSPILDAEGNVVGVAVGELLGGQNLNFGVSTVPLREDLVKSVTAPVRPLSAAPDRARNLIISAIVGVVAVLAYFSVPLILSSRDRKRAPLGRGRIRSRT
jgi:S1-C subfamily serine protease